MTNTGITQEHVQVVKDTGDTIDSLLQALNRSNAQFEQSAANFNELEALTQKAMAELEAEREKVKLLVAVLKELAEACEKGAIDAVNSDGEPFTGICYEDIQPLLRRAVRVLEEVEHGK